jgi:hypothetical protein
LPKLIKSKDRDIDFSIVMNQSLEDGDMILSNDESLEPNSNPQLKKTAITKKKPISVSKKNQSVVNSPIY